MDNRLMAGVCEVDITPAGNLHLAGNLKPHKRLAQGVDDPLKIYCLALQSGAVKAVWLAIDICGFVRDTLEDALQRSALETGVPVENIIWSVSHTHSGPVCKAYQSKYKYLVDQDYLREVKDKFVSAAKSAVADLQPARLTFCRAVVPAGFNRRIKTKTGKEVNTWLMSGPASLGQLAGAAGPIDPELCALAFIGMDGRMRAVVYNYALHCTSHFGPKYSADFPGTVNRRIKNEFGEECATLFLQGAAGDISPMSAGKRSDTTPRQRADFIGNKLADALIPELQNAADGRECVSIAVDKKVIEVPVRPTGPEEEWRLTEWPGEYAKDRFTKGFQALRDSGLKTVSKTMHALVIGDHAIVTLQGEPFVEYGMALKRHSPFPWTLPVGYAGSGGYLVTRQAWAAGGYECIPTIGNNTSVEGCEMMVAALLEMLGRMRKRQVLAGLFPINLPAQNGVSNVIRPLRPDDGEALARFYAAIPPEDYQGYCPHPLDRERALTKAARADDYNLVCLVVETPDGEIGGYAWYKWSKPEAERSEFGICLRKNLQGQGLGRKIMEVIMQTARAYGPPRMGLTVQPETNPGAYKLYVSLGFVKESESVRKKYNDLNYRMILTLCGFGVTH